MEKAMEKTEECIIMEKYAEGGCCENSVIKIYLELLND